MARVDERPRSMRVPDIRKGDQVLVLTGKEAGKKGTVEHVVRNRQSNLDHVPDIVIWPHTERAVIDMLD